METTRKVRTSANYQPAVGEINNSPSMTIPDMVPDIRTLIRRKAAGMSVPIFPAHYSPEDYPDFNKMDTVELIQYRTDLAEQMKDLEFELHSASKVLEQIQLNKTKSEENEPSA